MQERYQNLKIAQRGVLLNISAYIVLTLLKLVVGQLSHSATLIADGSNNLTDVFSSCAIMVGLRLAQRPPDEHHQYGPIRPLESRNNCHFACLLYHAACRLECPLLVRSGSALSKEYNPRYPCSFCGSL